MPALEPADLAALMVSYQRGDLPAFEALYAHLAPLLRRYLLSLARDPVWTDDLVQETFLQIHRSRHTYNAAYPVTPWAVAVARHVFLMGRRSRRRKGDFDHEPLADHDGAALRAHDEAFIAREAIGQGFGGLSARSGRVVWLHYVHGWSFREVGAKLGIGEAAAKLRASRGLALLRRNMKGKRRTDGD